MTSWNVFIRLCSSIIGLKRTINKFIWQVNIFSFGLHQHNKFIWQVEIFSFGFVPAQKNYMAGWNVFIQLCSITSNLYGRLKCFHSTLLKHIKFIWQVEMFSFNFAQAHQIYMAGWNVWCCSKVEWNHFNLPYKCACCTFQLKFINQEYAYLFPIFLYCGNILHHLAWFDRHSRSDLFLNEWYFNHWYWTSLTNWD